MAGWFTKSHEGSNERRYENTAEHVIALFVTNLENKEQRSAADEEELRNLRAEQETRKTDGAIRF